MLREVKYKETDKILTVLSETEGKLSVSARGVMGKSSNIAAACQLLTFSDMTFYERGGKLYIKEAQTVEQFLGLREDISLLALGAYFAEALEAASDEDSPNPAVLKLGLNSLFALSRGLHSPEHIKAVFELRLMCLSGFEPSLDYCPVCGNEPRSPVFSPRDGSCLCEKCCERGSGEVVRLTDAALAAMRSVVSADAKKIFSFAIDEESEKILFRLCETYFLLQLERSFLALDYWKSVN